jgi:hypothetical protein
MSRPERDRPEDGRCWCCTRQTGVSPVAASAGAPRSRLRAWRYVGDIKSYFDSIDHGKLLKRVERRIWDRRGLKVLAVAEGECDGGRGDGGGDGTGQSPGRGELAAAGQHLP